MEWAFFVACLVIGYVLELIQIKRNKDISRWIFFGWVIAIGLLMTMLESHRPGTFSEMHSKIIRWLATGTSFRLRTPEQAYRLASFGMNALFVAIADLIGIFTCKIIYDMRKGRQAQQEPNAQDEDQFG